MMLQAQGLRCERDYRLLFDDLSFELNSGEALRFLGANGTGKTTLLRMICGLYQDYDGEIIWQDVIYEEGFLYQGHAAGIKDNLTAEENLDYLLRLESEVKTTREELHKGLHAVGLEGFEDIFCGSLSAGQKKRVNLARFFLSQHHLWVMDEPFSAIDAEGVGILRQLMDNHLGRGGALVITSHQDMKLDHVVKEVWL